VWWHGSVRDRGWCKRYGAHSPGIDGGRQLGITQTV
jgi:hypothetical protein